jgi:hypothetical protein
VGLAEGGTAAKARAQALAKLERLIARGQERGDLSRGFAAADLAVAFDSLSNGTVDHWLFEDTSGSLRERMQRAAEIFLGPVALGAHAKPGEPLPELLPPLGDEPRAPVPFSLTRDQTRRRR